MQTQQSILLADDHGLVREGIKEILRQSMDGVEVHEAVDFDTTLDKLTLNPAYSVALIDLSMPGMSGPPTFSTLKAAAPAVPIMVISSDTNAAQMKACFTHGAVGYIEKSVTGKVMVKAVELVLAGGVYVPGLLSRQNDPVAETGGLSERQIDVLRLAAKGLSNREIAEVLNISPATVKSHMSAIFTITKVANRTQLTNHATRLGLI